MGVRSLSSSPSLFTSSWKASSRDGSSSLVGLSRRLIPPENSFKRVGELRPLDTGEDASLLSFDIGGLASWLKASCIPKPFCEEREVGENGRGTSSSR